VATLLLLPEVAEMRRVQWPGIQIRGRKHSKNWCIKGDYSVGASATLYLGGAGRHLVSPRKRSTLNMAAYRTLLPCLYTTAVLRSCSVRGSFALGEGSMKNYSTNNDEALTNIGCRRGVLRRTQGDDPASRSTSRPKLEFIAGERVDSRDWSQGTFVRAC